MFEFEFGLGASTVCCGRIHLPFCLFQSKEAQLASRSHRSAHWSRVELLMTKVPPKAWKLSKVVKATLKHPGKYGICFPLNLKAYTAKDSGNNVEDERRQGKCC